MPGRTPSEAFEAFMEPIKAVVSCLGSAKIMPSAGGRSAPAVVHSWALNGSTGMAFSGGWHFEAMMHYELVQGAVSREWKVKTHGYRYRLAIHGSHLWRIHWHPTITSGYDLPHVHLNLGLPGEVPDDAMGQHHPTGRMTFEDAVEWVFNQDISPARADWRDVLNSSRDLHIEHRTWSTHPPA
jgi:hypothetical protein